jgi:hypothetical protein
MHKEKQMGPKFIFPPKLVVKIVGFVFHFLHGKTQCHNYKNYEDKGFPRYTKTKMFISKANLNLNPNIRCENKKIRTQSMQNKSSNENLF